MHNDSAIDTAIWHLKQGHIIAYPTEAVYGLGCDPFNEHAVAKLLQLKQRPIEKGLIVLVTNWQQVLDLSTALMPAMRARLKQTWPGPVTWLLPANENVPQWLTGEHDSIAVRMTAHPIAKRLCQAWDKPLVSSSANTAALPAAKNKQDILKHFPTGIDFILTGKLGDLKNPTPIYDIRTGAIIRT